MNPQGLKLGVSTIQLLMFISLITLGYLGQSCRKGKITWGVIEKNPHSLINPRFLLEPKIGNPTRMKLKDIKIYWNSWVLKEAKGDPFSFLSVKDDDGDGEGGSQG